MHTIYALADPENPYIPCYVGRTKNSIRVRLQGNSKLIKKTPNHPFAAWLIDLKKRGVSPVSYTLQQVEDFDGAQKQETFWIQYFRSFGTLKNLSDGPGGLNIRGRPAHPNCVAATIARNKLGWSEETRRKQIACRKGRKQKPQRVERWKAHPSYSVIQEKLRQCNESRKKPIVCDETGERFDSIRGLCRAIGCRQSQFHEAMRQGWRLRGRYWRFEKEVA